MDWGAIKACFAWVLAISLLALLFDRLDGSGDGIGISIVSDEALSVRLFNWIGTLAYIFALVGIINRKIRGEVSPLNSLVSGMDSSSSKVMYMSIYPLNLVSGIGAGASAVILVLGISDLVDGANANALGYLFGSVLIWSVIFGVHWTLDVLGSRENSSMTVPAIIAILICFLLSSLFQIVKAAILFVST